MSTLYVDNLQPNLGSRVMAAGHVVQVQQTIYNTASPISTTNTSYVNSGIEVTITPTSNTSKVLVRAFAQIYVSGTSHGHIAIYRNNTNELLKSSIHWDNDANAAGQGMIEILDSPNTTSATTYSIYFKSRASGSTVYINGETYSDAGITAMEIAQ